jgi:hypothetical protein
MVALVKETVNTSSRTLASLGSAFEKVARQAFVCLSSNIIMKEQIDWQSPHSFQFS